MCIHSCTQRDRGGEGKDGGQKERKRQESEGGDRMERKRRDIE